MNDDRKNTIKNYVIGIIIPLAVGGLSALITMSAMESFGELNQPTLSPPAYLFPIMWTILYILMGISSTMVYRYGGEAAKKPLIIYGAQLIVNFFWSIFFFNLNLFLFSFIWVILLWILVLWMIVSFSKIKPAAAYLQFPYLLWLTFAGYLNYMIYILNK